MSLDMVVSERLRHPNAWEMARYKSSASERAEWSRLFDESRLYRHDESVLRVSEAWERRQRQCAPTPAMAGSAPRITVFRALFQKDIGGVSGASSTWLDTGFRAVDGVSGKISDWIDYIDSTHTFTQSLSAKQCLVPTANAAFANALTANFNAAPLYSSSRGPTGFTYTVDGSGCDVCVVFRPTANNSGAVILGCFTGGSNAFYISRATTTHGLSVWAPFATTQVVATASGTLALNVATYTEDSFKSGATPEWSHGIKSVVTTSGSVLTAPSATAPTVAMTLGGARPTDTSVMSMEWCALYAHRRVLSAAEKTIQRAWIRAQTGIV